MMVLKEFKNIFSSGLKDLNEMLEMFKKEIPREKNFGLAQKIQVNIRRINTLLLQSPDYVNSSLQRNTAITLGQLNTFIPILKRNTYTGNSLIEWKVALGDNIKKIIDGFVQIKLKIDRL